MTDLTPGRTAILPRLQRRMQVRGWSGTTVARAVSVTARRFAVVLALLMLGALAAAPVGADLQSQIDASRSRDRALQSEIAADSRTIDGFQGRIDDVRARLAGIQHSLDLEEAQLAQLRTQLRDARARLVTLRLRLARDREVLARQLVGQYESPQPDLISVVLDAHGFADLLERVDQLKRIADQNTETTTRVHDEELSVRALSRKLNDMVITQQHVTSAQMIQRDEVAQLQFALQARQAPYLRSRARRQAQLASLRSERKSLEKRLASFQVRAAAAYGLGAGVPFSPGGGSYGFFPAAGHELQRRQRAGDRARAWTGSARRCTCTSSACRATGRRRTRSRSAASPTTRTRAARRRTRRASRACPSRPCGASASRGRSPARVRPTTSSSRRRQKPLDRGRAG